MKGVEKDKKKAEKIKQMVGTLTTLEAAASALKDSVITVDSIRITGGQGLRDGKILGAIFNASNKGKVVPDVLAGSDAGYVIRVDDLSTTSVMTGDIPSQQQQMRIRAKQMQMVLSSPISIMRKTATIKDNRRNFY